MKIKRLFDTLIEVNPLHFIWMGVLLAELLTVIVSTISCRLLWGHVSEKVVIIGAIDSFVVGFTVSVFIFYFVRKTRMTVIANEQLLKEIEERKRVEKEKEDLFKQLQHAQKMEAIGRLAAGVAHDFNNILTTIIGYSEIGMRKSVDAPYAQKKFQTISESAKRAATLTEQLLMFSRKQVLQLLDLDLNVVIINMKEMVQRLIGEDITFEFKHGENCTIRGDKSLLEQIVMNLAVNARDALPNGGHFFLETSEILLKKEDTLHLKDLAPGYHIKLTATDTGTGMTDDVLAHIFEPFFTTKELGKGTGLGLATVYGIIKQHKGEISVTSKLSKGTTFTIYLPTSQGVSIPEKKEIHRDLPKGNETILVVEDESKVRKLIIAILKPLGYSLLEAQNGEDALLIGHHYNNTIHLLLTDIVMPGMNGRELAEQLTEWLPEIKTIFMSGYTNDIISQHGVLDSGVTFINKPFSPTQMAKIVRIILDESA